MLRLGHTSNSVSCYCSSVASYCAWMRGILKMIGPSSKTWILAVWAAGTFAVLTAVALFPV